MSDPKYINLIKMLSFRLPFDSIDNLHVQSQQQKLQIKFQICSNLAIMTTERLILLFLLLILTYFTVSTFDF